MDNTENTIQTIKGFNGHSTGDITPQSKAGLRTEIIELALADVKRKLLRHLTKVKTQIAEQLDSDIYAMSEKYDPAHVPHQCPIWDMTYQFVLAHANYEDHTFTASEIEGMTNAIRNDIVEQYNLPKLKLMRSEI